MRETLTANKVAQHLDISVITLTNWYKWYNNDEYEKPANMPKLPDYIQAGSRGTRHWYKDELPMLEVFKEWLPKGRGGVMGQYNAKFWGERGKRALKNSK